MNEDETNCDEKERKENRPLFVCLCKDKVARMTDQLGNQEIYSYDGNDNLISITDRKGQKTEYTYDYLDRVTDVQYADGNSTTYDYDAVSRLTTVTVTDTDTGMIEYSYSNTGCSACGRNAVDRIVKEITSLGTIEYEYDAIGRRTSMTVAGQPTVNYSYDSDSHLTNISTNRESSILNFGLSYDALGRKTSLTLPNGVNTNYSYDNASRLLNLESLNPLNAVLEQSGYAYDANGNRMSMDRQNVSAKLPTTSSNAAYNTANQMTTLNGYSLTYDNNGNLLTLTRSCGITNYIWNARNQLIAIDGYDDKCQSVSASFKYDAFGRRIEKTVNGKATAFLYDGIDIVQEIENGTVTANYIRTLNIDEPLARIKNDGLIRYYQQDALGSVMALTDEVGNIKTQYSYDPFGNTEIIGEASDNPFQYTGRENDGTGLYYYRFRYYSPELQRFIREDRINLTSLQLPIPLFEAYKYKYPNIDEKALKEFLIKYSQVHPLTLNRYLFDYDNPLVYRDPYGDYPLWVVATAWTLIVTTFAEIVSVFHHEPPKHIEPEVPEPWDPRRGKPIDKLPPEAEPIKPVRCR